jgi:hypothetical protein
VKLLHGGVRGAELEKREQSSPKHALSHYNPEREPREATEEYNLAKNATGKT